MIGVTRERVRQIQVEALKRLRKILEREGMSADMLLK
jgi:RNA polymerase nonessential primary-like sigma factor